jgi:hypothetical protein
MMGSNQKKILALAVLVVFWGTLAIWQWFSIEEPVRVPLTNVTGRASVQQTARTPGAGLHVRLDLLAAAKTQREMTFTAPRNIFTLPASAGGGQLGLDSGADPSQRQHSVVTELAQFHYLGFVRTGEEWEQKRDLAVLTKNDDLHLVRKGETVENHVIVKAITQESVTLQDRDSRVEHTVLLSDEEPAQP